MWISAHKNNTKILETQNLSPNYWKTSILLCASPSRTPFCKQDCFPPVKQLSNAPVWVPGKFPFISSNFPHKCMSEITWFNDVISVPASSAAITEGEKKIKEWIPWVPLLVLHYFLFENYSSMLHLELPFSKLNSPISSAEYADMTTHT